MPYSLHIIAFNVPYPANYGGIIDVFSRIKNLHREGVEIILHCFQYGRAEADEMLGVYCEKIYYYERDMRKQNLFSSFPFIVKTRANKLLLQRLQQDEYPILCEGTHCTFWLRHPSLQERFKMVRMHNVEWKYYYNLARMESHIFRKIYFYWEAYKLKKYELKTLKQYASALLCVSKEEQKYFSQHQYKNVEYMSSSNPNDTVDSLEGRGEYLLFHGDLSVIDNEQAVLWMMENIADKIDLPFYVAGLNPSAILQQQAKKHKTVSLFPNLSNEEMSQLIQNAHINILYSNQAVGLKIKLLNALYQGRFVLGNANIITIENLKPLCFQFETAGQAIAQIKEVVTKEFSKKDIQKRRAILEKPPFSNRSKARQIIGLLATHFPPTL